MTTDTDVAITITPTTNEWDAPAWVSYDDDRNIVGLSRHMPPEDWDPSAWAVFPHAQVFVNGELSVFDADRQPTDRREADRD